jgi:hypothetical protein
MWINRTFSAIRKSMLQSASSESGERLTMTPRYALSLPRGAADDLVQMVEILWPFLYKHTAKDNLIEIVTEP